MLNSSRYFSVGGLFVSVLIVGSAGVTYGRTQSLSTASSPLRLLRKNHLQLNIFNKNGGDQCSVAAMANRHHGWGKIGYGLGSLGLGGGYRYYFQKRSMLQGTFIGGFAYLGRYEREQTTQSPGGNKEAKEHLLDYGLHWKGGAELALSIFQLTVNGYGVYKFDASSGLRKHKDKDLGVGARLSIYCVPYLSFLGRLSVFSFLSCDRVNVVDRMHVIALQGKGEWMIEGGLGFQIITPYYLALEPRLCRNSEGSWSKGISLQVHLDQKKHRWWSTPRERLYQLPQMYETERYEPLDTGYDVVKKGVTSTFARVMQKTTVTLASVTGKYQRFN